MTRKVRDLLIMTAQIPRARRSWDKISLNAKPISVLDFIKLGNQICNIFQTEVALYIISHCNDLDLRHHEDQLHVRVNEHRRLCSNFRHYMHHNLNEGTSIPFLLL